MFQKLLSNATNHSVSNSGSLVLRSLSFPCCIVPTHYYYDYFCTHAGKVVFKLFQEHIGEKYIYTFIITRSSQLTVYLGWP